MAPTTHVAPLPPPTPSPLAPNPGGLPGPLRPAIRPPSPPAPCPPPLSPGPLWPPPHLPRPSGPPPSIYPGPSGPPPSPWPSGPPPISPGPSVPPAHLPLAPSPAPLALPPSPLAPLALPPSPLAPLALSLPSLLPHLALPPSPLSQPLWPSFALKATGIGWIAPLSESCDHPSSCLVLPSILNPPCGRPLDTILAPLMPEPYLAVMINPGWQQEGTSIALKESMDMYVENLTWVWLAPNNSIVQESYPYGSRVLTVRLRIFPQ
eukprot:gene32272-16839_t